MQLERKQLHQNKAIVPVHLFGRAANMEAIMAIAKSITICNRDNAQAIGANCKILWWNQESRNYWSCSFNFLFHLKFRMLWRWWSHFTNDDALAHKLRGSITECMSVTMMLMCILV
jgi:hypothetical protein